MTQPAGAPATSGVPAGGSGTGLASSEAGARRPRRISPYVGLIPFFVYVSIFLLLPTLIVAAGAFQDAAGQFTLANIQAVFSGPGYIDSFVRSIQLSISTAIAGASLGALLAWAVAGGNPGGWLRQSVIAASGVLAQFGGVMLAFAFIATFGFGGTLTVLLEGVLGKDTLSGGTWLYSMTGLTVVYTFFQIPLMLIVFLPAVDGLARSGGMRPRASAAAPGPTGVTSRARCSRRRSSARRSCCSRTRSPPTPPQPRW